MSKAVLVNPYSKMPEPIPVRYARPGEMDAAAWTEFGMPSIPEWDGGRRIPSIRHFRAIIRTFKEDGCVKCGETFLAALEFHHRDPAEKLFTVSRAFNDGRSIQEVLEEIAKCDVVCANCHRKEHYSV
jgi:hypothetical protein